MTAKEIINKYIQFFEQRGHIMIQNSSLVPLNDPTTLFTSSGMQPLVPYLLGETHPQGSRLVNVQNCFRAQDIDEVGDNRHTTFFRMLGNWSLGDYFKTDQIPWFFEFLTRELNIDPKKLYVTVFKGFEDLELDHEAESIWEGLFESSGIDSRSHISYYGAEKNWWSRSGTPDKMPAGEPGGPSTEVFYDFGENLRIHEQSKFADENCHPNCDCGRFIEIGNSVFMAYKKQEDGRLAPLSKPNVDFGGGLERLLMAIENQQDVFRTSLFSPIISTIENVTAKKYEANSREMRIVLDHMLASVFITADGVIPSNKEQGYVLRRFLRRGFDNFYALGGESIVEVLDRIVDQYKVTDEKLLERYEHIKNTILEEDQKYRNTLREAKRFIAKKYKKIGDELLGVTEISADDAFILYTTHGLSPTQIKSLGYTFDLQAFATKMEEHSKNSRTASAGKFKGGLADHSEKTIMGHTATHLMHQAIRDILGDEVHQTGSNITSERVRFDFNFDRKLTDEEIKKIETIVNEKINENLPVHFEILPIEEAKKIGAIGLFEDKYAKDVKVYFIGGSNPYSKTHKRGQKDAVYSIEFCGGPHVDFTGILKEFKILKEESLGKSNRRIYATVA